MGDTQNAYISILSKIEMYELQDLGESKLLTYNGTCFHIGGIFFDCINHIKQGESVEGILAFLEAKYNLTLDNYGLIRILTDSIDKIDSEYHKSESSLFDSIYLRSGSVN